MPQPLQPISEAIQRGEKQQAIELIKQALSIDPYDIERLLILATLVDAFGETKYCLQRRYDSSIAREMNFQVAVTDIVISLSSP